MTVAKACLGYASRTDAVRALRAEGLGTHAIAARTGISPKNVSSLEASVRRLERERARPAREVSIREPATGAIAELVPYHQRELVRRHAAARDMSCARLIQTIVDCVIENDLIDAVLDDGKSGDPR